MGIGTTLKSRRTELGLTRSQLAERVHVTPSAIANYENDISTPKTNILISLINVLEIDANYLYRDYLVENQLRTSLGRSLSPAEIDSLEKYRVLDEQSKEMVHLIVNAEYERQLKEGSVAFPCHIPGPRHLHSGFLLLEQTRTVRVKRKDLYPDMDACFQVQLDCYAPIFRKYDILALKRTEVRPNELGIFILNGVHYIRTLYQENSVRCLRALNVMDPDILIGPDDDLECFAQILGRVHAAFTDLGGGTE